MVGGKIDFQQESVFVLSADTSAPTQNPESVVNTHIARFAAQSRRQAKEKCILQQLQDDLYLQQDGSESGSNENSRPKKSMKVPLRLIAKLEDPTLSQQQGKIISRSKNLRQLRVEHGGRPLPVSSHLRKVCSCIDCQPTALVSQPHTFDFSSSSSPSPPKWIGSVDPFDNFPVKLDDNGRLLLNHYQFSIPSALFGIDRVDGFSIQKNIFFPIAMRNKLWFLQMLAFAGLHRDRALRLSHDSPVTSAYLGAAVRAINDCIADPNTRYSRSIAGAVSSAAYIEYANGRTTAFEAHVRGLSHILKRRQSILKAEKGSKAQVEHDVDAVTITHLLCFGKAHVDMARRAWTHGDETVLGDAQEMLTGADKTILLLKKIAIWDRLRRERSSYDNASSLESKLHLQQLIIFAPTSILMRLLREPERLKIPSLQVAIHEESHRLFALCYVILASWEHREDPVRDLDFLSDLRSTIIEHSVKAYTATRLVWIFLRCVGNDRPDRRWRTVEMVRTLHMLGNKTREIVTRYLMSIIEDIGRGRNSGFDLNLDAIKSEVYLAEMGMPGWYTSG